MKKKDTKFIGTTQGKEVAIYPTENEAREHVQRVWSDKLDGVHLTPVYHEELTREEQRLHITNISFNQ